MARRDDRLEVVGAGRRRRRAAVVPPLEGVLRADAERRPRHDGPPAPLIDQRKQQIASLEPLADKIRGFGLDVEEIDGHDPAAIDAALDRRTTGPKFLVMRTVKGKGVSFMEGLMEWHYLPLNDQQYAQAISERTLV